MAPLTVTLVILVVAMLLFLSGRMRPDLIALLVAISLGITGVLTAQEVFSGFSRSAVITMAAIFVLAEGLQRTGVIDQVSAFLHKIGGAKERSLLIGVTLSGALLSLFMNNIAAASVLLPAAAGAARRSHINPAKILMPLAFGTILGGMATLLTTTNIVVSSLLREQGFAGYGLLDFAPLGVPLVAVGVLYLVLLGARLLPAQTRLDHWGMAAAEQANLAGVYRLDERLVWARVPPGSGLAGKTLGESDLRQSFGLNLVAIQRHAQTIMSPSPEARINQGDILLLEGRPEELSPEALKPALELLSPDHSGVQELESQRIVLVEAVLAPRSALIGQTLREAHFREKYDLNVIAIWRSGSPIRTNLSDLKLQFGDALLVQGARERMAVLRAEPDLIILMGEQRRASPNTRLAWAAVLIMALALSLAAFNLVPVAEAMLGGALAMTLAGILTMDRAYQVIDWKTIFLIAGMLPLSIALAKTGAAAQLGNVLVSLLGPAGPMALLGGLVLLAMLMSQVMNGAAVAAIVAPVAIGAAGQLGADPRAMAMGVALAASMTFLTPLGHPVNMLVMGPGGYRFQDYFKMGLPLTVLLLAVMLILFPVFWPLTAH